MGRRHRQRQAHRAPPAERVPLARQDTLEQAYRRWEAMHASGTSGLPSTLDAVKQSSWVYSAVTFIAEHIMRTRLQVFRAGSETERVERHPIQQLLERPSAYTDQNTSAKFRYAYTMELLLHGSVMRLLGRFTGFRPGTMSVRPRWQFRVQEGADEFGRFCPVAWILQHRGQEREFIPEDSIYHDTLYNPLHDYEGLSPLTAALLSVANDTDINEFAQRFFKNDGSTGIVFSTEHPSFGQKQAEDAAKKWRETHSGLRNAFGVKFVGFGLVPHNVGSPLDAKMLQILRSFTKEEIVSGIYKIPLDAISAKDGGGDIVIGGPSGGTQASAREAFLINVIMPWAARYDEEFNRDITWRFDTAIEVRHDFTDNPILERRRLERAKAAVELIDRGVPLNEIIRWLHLEIVPQPHGDDWWIQNDRLPARVVLDAGDKALEIAIPKPPQPGDGPGPAGGDKGQKRRQAILTEYIARILRQADTATVRELAHADPALRAAGNGKRNGQRVTELLAGGTQGRLPPGAAGRGSALPPPPALS